MILARVYHERCDHGVVATTYVWVPTDMTKEEFRGLVQKAKDARLQAEKDLKDFPGKPFDPGWNPNYDRYPDKSVAEVKKLHDEAKIVYKQWEEKRDAARKFFSTHLKEVGGGRILNFWEDEFEIQADVYWGHQHGVTLNYDEQSPTDGDLEGTEKYPERY